MEHERIGIGKAPRRVEDQRFLTGEGTYVDDVVEDGMVHAVVLRSPHAHARIAAIDTADALAAPGVLAILAGADQEAAGIRPVLPYQEQSPLTGSPFTYPRRMPLALGTVRHVGEPVAVAIAKTREQARDAAELIAVDYQTLPATTSVQEAAPGDLCGTEDIGDKEAVEAAFAAAAHVTRLDLVNHRIITNPMEPRGAIGMFDAGSGRYTLRVSSQGLHMVRDNVAATLGVEPRQLRLLAEDVGGGFGAKNFPYPEYALMLWAAREVGRPVKWINVRSETFVADDQARDHVSHVELALDAEGKFQALRISTTVNLGAYLDGAMGAVGSTQYVALMGSVYAVPAFHLDLRMVHTNLAPLGVTRGPGFAEAAYLMERLIDAAAGEMDIDCAELRRRNLIPAGALPFTHAMGGLIDSGDFAANQTSVLERADGDGFAARRKESKARGMLRGLGIAHHIKITFGPPEENVELRFDADNQVVTLTTGTIAIGQGHETTFRQIVSELLGVPNGRVRYRAGDTDLIAKGGGHGSSRATFMAGSAMHFAAQEIIEKGRHIAAHVLEAAAGDIEFAGGSFTITGTDRSLDIFEVARIAEDAERRPEGMAPGLFAYHLFTREHGTVPNGCHVAEVEIDPETGVTRLIRFTAVDDYGVIVNPVVAHGQVHGALAQGAGQALMEHAVYDPESGQLLSGSFMDYALPRADDLPSFDVTFEGIPCTTNPLGVKGLGEAGAIGAFPAIVNAVLDALAPYGVTNLDGPATPDRIWRAIHNS